MDTVGSRQKRVDELVAEISAISRELAEVSLRAELAADRRDLDILADATDRASDLQARWRLTFRELLVKKTTTGPLAEYSSL